MTADLSLSIVGFFPFIFPFNHMHCFFNCVGLEMSQKKNSGRQLTIDLFDNEDDNDFEDDFDNMKNVHNMTLAELFGRDEQRRDERVRRERDERQALRAQTQDKTVINSGILLLLFCFRH